jgi:hypothetical protein
MVRRKRTRSHSASRPTETGPQVFYPPYLCNWRVSLGSFLDHSNRDSPDGRRIERNSASSRFPLQGEAVALADRWVVTHGRGRSVQNSLIFPSSGRTSPLVFARTTTERLTPVRDQAADALIAASLGLVKNVSALRAGDQP